MKIGMCGCFAMGVATSDGQIIKTNMVYSSLTEFLGNDSVHIVDSYYWKKNFLKLLVQCFFLVKKCEHIVLLPAQNGMRVFVPLFLLLNKIYKRKLHIVAIGGWLADFLKTRENLVKQLTRISSIHVESKRIIDELKRLGIHNVYYMPNIKRMEPVKADEITYDPSEVIRSCTFSRVMKEKGIDIAVKSVCEANRILGKTAYTIDIYGLIESEYKRDFEVLLKTSDDCVTYKGIIPSGESVKTLREYSLLLFPTYYEGEGFAGTLLDSMASGLPVLASDWKYNPEIIVDGYNGFLCETKDMTSVVDKLLYIYRNRDILMDMKLNCIEHYKNYDYRNVIIQFLKVIEQCI